MFTLLAGLASAAWGFVAPWFGPIVAVVLPWFRRARDRVGGLTGGIAPFSTTLVFLIAVGLIVWLSLRLTSKPPAPKTVTVAEVELVRQRETLSALQRANTRLQQAYSKRDEEASRLQATLALTKHELEQARHAARDKTNGPRPVFDADDPWLRAKRQRAAR